MNTKHITQWTLLLFSFLICSCEFFFPFSRDGISYEINITSSQFTLYWDYNTQSLSSFEKEVLSFCVYYRKTNTQAWYKLGSVPWTENPSFTINRSVLSPGKYIFAVTSMLSARESNKHTSEDFNADPEPWYVNWTPLYY